MPIGLTNVDNVKASIDIVIFKSLITRIVDRAAELGYVITVEQTPLEPLAMGHYRTEVSVRKARTHAEPRKCGNES